MTTSRSNAHEDAQPPLRVTATMSEPDRHHLPWPVLATVVALLALPVVAVLMVPLYARRGPELWGFPFFYWYQFLWVLLAAICTSVAYRIVQTYQRRDRGEQ